jgi:hypothetical protein
MTGLGQQCEFPSFGCSRSSAILSRLPVSTRDRLFRRTGISSTSTANDRFQSGPVARPEDRRGRLWVVLRRPGNREAAVRRPLVSSLRLPAIDCAPIPGRHRLTISPQPTPLGSRFDLHKHRSEKESWQAARRASSQTHLWQASPARSPRMSRGGTRMKPTLARLEHVTPRAAWKHEPDELTPLAGTAREPKPASRCPGSPRVRAGGHRASGRRLQARHPPFRRLDLKLTQFQCW